MGINPVRNSSRCDSKPSDAPLTPSLSSVGEREGVRGLIEKEDIKDG